MDCKDCPFHSIACDKDLFNKCLLEEIKKVEYEPIDFQKYGRYQTQYDVYRVVCMKESDSDGDRR